MGKNGIIAIYNVSNVGTWAIIRVTAQKLKQRSEQTPATAVVHATMLTTRAFTLKVNRSKVDPMWIYSILPSQCCRRCDIFFQPYQTIYFSGL